MIRACLILFCLTAIAIVWHTIPDRSKIAGLESQVSGLFPEQKFLFAGPIDINEATIEELEAIPRIGPSLAKKIIEFRAEKGKMNTLDELLNIKGVGIRLLSTIKPYLKAEE